jgi:hypothetical protein
MISARRRPAAPRARLKPRSKRDAVSGRALEGDGPFGGRRFTGDLKAVHRAG